MGFTAYIYNYITSYIACSYARLALVNIYADLPPAPLGVYVTMVTSTLIQLEWSQPQLNGTLSHYTVTCSPDSGGSTVRQKRAVSESVIVSNLRPVTNYTCCVSATNQAGQGNETCVQTRTEIGDNM